MRIAPPLALALLCATLAFANPNYWIDHGAHEVSIVAGNEQLRYHCTFGWQVTFTDGSMLTDRCSADIDAGARSQAVCTKSYRRPVQSAELTSGICKPREGR